MYEQLKPEQPRPLILDNDTTWVVVAITQQKPEVVADMLLQVSEITAKKPFFKINDDFSSEDEQLPNIDWPSLARDAQMLQGLITWLKIKPLAHLETQLFANILLNSPLFKALNSSSILVTREQQNGSEQPITPLGHTIAVSSYPVDTRFLLEEDEHNLKIINYVHDLGKMAAVNYLAEMKGEKIDYVRQMLEVKYGSDGKHSHPKHAFVSTIIVHRLLEHIKQQPQTLAVQEFLEDEDSVSLLLNVTFHHHHFLYKGDIHEDEIEEWFWNEVKTKLEPTLPSNRPDLLIRFMMLLATFRIADIAATESHHKHWAKNKQWMQYIPNILRKKLDSSKLHDELIDRYQKTLALLPYELS